MRWIPVLIVAYLVTLVQMSLGQVLVFDRLSIGPIGPDFVAILVVFLALVSRTRTDAMLAGWLLGFLLDLTTGGSLGGVSRLGVMAFLFAMGSWMVFAVREAIFRDRALPQMLLATVFVVLTHGLWITLHVLLGASSLGWSEYGRALMQVLLSAIYTALLMPLGFFAFSLIRGLLVPTQTTRDRRSRIGGRSSGR